MRPATPANVLSGIGRRERSGVNLPAASASAAFRSARPSIGATEWPGVLASARSTTRRSSGSVSAMTMAPPAGSLSPRFSSRPASIFFLVNLPTSPPTAPPTTAAPSIGGLNRPTRTPTPPPQPRPLRPRWSAVWDTVTCPSVACSTRMMPSALTVPSATSADSASKSCRAASVDGYAAMISSSESLIDVSVVLEAGSGVRSRSLDVTEHGDSCTRAGWEASPTLGDSGSRRPARPEPGFEGRSRVGRGSVERDRRGRFAEVGPHVGVRHPHQELSHRCRVVHVGQ